MSIARITISVPSAVAARIRRSELRGTLGDDAVGPPALQARRRASFHDALYFTSSDVG
jgi:hypothetical protein